jgi:drug/metabolite transporter (DMT)-like permease
LLLWSFSAVCAAVLKTLPSFQVLTITFFCGFLYCAIRIMLTKKWRELKQPWYVWAIGILGIGGQQILYIFSFKYAPPIQADLIIYTWPIMVVLLLQFIKKLKNFRRALLSTFLGFCGVVLLFLSDPSDIGEINSGVLLGYGMAFMCAVFWSLYTVLSKNFKCPSEIVGFYGLYSAVICGILHFSLEETVMPSFVEWIVLAVMGVCITGLSYYLWDKGIKKGNFQLLSILSYTNPILSITWLAVFGLGEVHLITLVSACMIMIGAFLGGVTPKQWFYFKEGVKHLRLFLRLKDNRSTLAVIRQQRVQHGDFAVELKKRNTLFRQGLTMKRWALERSRYNKQSRR